jgi:hypothetical protein
MMAATLTPANQVRGRHNCRRCRGGVAQEVLAQTQGAIRIGPLRRWEAPGSRVTRCRCPGLPRREATLRGLPAALRPRPRGY